MVLLLGAAYFWISARAAPHLYNDADKVPGATVGVLLGTSRYLSGGRENLYFKYRIDAVEELFRKRKISYILVSGDNSEKSYNEPQAMFQALVARGIPKENIELDYAGFRTLDSMVRARKVFGQKRFVVISQKFHNERAVFIARANDIEAVGFNARDVKVNFGFKTRLREVLARGKMILDLYIFNTQPRFLGEKVEIGEG